MAQQPDLDGKRDLARHFGIHGDMRTPFKVLLKELEGEGFIARKRKADPPHRAPARGDRRSTSPPTPIPKTSTPSPRNWDEDEGEPPRVERAAAPRTPASCPGPATASSPASSATADRCRTTPRKAMKILEKPRRGQIGIVRMDDDGARLIPVDRKQKEMRIPAGDLGGAKRRRSRRGRGQASPAG